MPGQKERGMNFHKAGCVQDSRHFVIHHVDLTLNNHLFDIRYSKKMNKSSYNLHLDLQQHLQDINSTTNQLDYLSKLNLFFKYILAI